MICTSALGIYFCALMVFSGDIDAGFLVYIIPKNSVLKKKIKEKSYYVIYVHFCQRRARIAKIAQVKNPSACKFRASSDRETETSGQTIQSLAHKKGRFWKKLSQKSGKVIFQQKTKQIMP